MVKSHTSSSPIHISSTQVDHIAHLANIPTNEQERERLAQEFTDTLQVVDTLKQVDVTGVEPTHQVTGLENVWREDVIDTERMFSQSQALVNATNTYNGYFVVSRVLEDKTV